MRYQFFTLSFTVWLTVISADIKAQQENLPGDGFVYADLTLDTQLVRLSFSPDLSADDQAAQALLSGMVGSRARIGVLEGHRALRLGSITPNLNSTDIEPPAVNEDPRTPPRNTTQSYDVWLTRSAQGWELEARTWDTGNTLVIPIAHHMADMASLMFTASIHATAAEAGRLVLHWGHHTWTTDLRFDELPPPPRRRRDQRIVERGNDFDPAETARTNELTRGFILRERNESALALPDGARIAVVAWKGLDVEDEDYMRLSTTADGAVVRLVRAAVLRLKTDVPLRFDNADLPTGNLSPGFAGAYGIWLRKTGNGWRFIFNNEPDVWGTQHDAELDAAEIAVDYSRTEGAFRPLGATVMTTGSDQGRLIVHWGLHEWAADFTIVR